jgi:hypothetical protein
MRTISDAETHPVVDRDMMIRDRLIGLQKKISAASFEKRSSKEVVSGLQVILKSSEITCAPEFIVFVGRTYPALMMEVMKDELISKRIRHLYRVAEIGSCFSKESIGRLNRGIEYARKRVFEIDQEA